MDTKRTNQIRRAVQTSYGRVAKGETGGQPEESSCCGTAPASREGPTDQAAEHARRIGYSEEEVRAVPQGANLGLGCGNPQAIAALKPGETVLDLGSGGGFDCFLAAKQVGENGQVIGVDMTPEMLARARENSRKSGLAIVSFRLGEIEHLPVADGTVDAVISNCVINLSVDKVQVYREASRVLKPGGRLAISDTAVTAQLPQEIREDLSLYTGCVGGAITPEEMEAMIREAGFEEVSVTPKNGKTEFLSEWIPGHRAEDYVIAVNVAGTKPAW